MLAGLLVAVVSGIGLLTALAASSGAVPPSDGGARPTRSDAPVMAPLDDGTTFRDFAYDAATLGRPTSSNAQSKLWFAHDRWWAGLFQPSTGWLTIFYLDWDTQRWVDTGVLIDERPDADPDFLWSGESLYVATGGPPGSARDAGRIMRYGYDERDERFELDANFPVTIAGDGTPAPVIAVDSTGTVWIAYSAADRIWVAHSVDHDAHWSTPFALPVDRARIAVGAAASIVAFGPGRIGVMWSNPVFGRVDFSWHQDGDPPDAWSEPEVVLDGLGSSDDPISMKSFPTSSGRGVVATVKTAEPPDDQVNQLGPQILLAVRADDGPWTTHLVSQVRDRYTRSVVVVDGDQRSFYVVATSPGAGGEIRYKRAAIDDPRFDTGPGEVLMASVEDPQINDATTTKQDLTSASGLVVLASDNETGRYLHALSPTGRSQPPADPAEPGRGDSPDPPSPLPPNTLMSNDFEPWTTGSAEGATWALRDDDPSTAISIAADGDGGRVLRLENHAEGGVRACRDFAEVLDGRLTIEVRARASAFGATDTSLILLRGPGGEAGGVRVRGDGVIAWFDGASKGRGIATLEPRAWYRVTVTVDQAARTYDLAVSSDTGELISERSGLDWRSPDVRFVRTVCFETTSGPLPQQLDVAGVSVRTLPVR